MNDEVEYNRYEFERAVLDDDRLHSGEKYLCLVLAFKMDWKTGVKAFRAVPHRRAWLRTLQKELGPDIHDKFIANVLKHLKSLNVISDEYYDDYQSAIVLNTPDVWHGKDEAA